MDIFVYNEYTVHVIIVNNVLIFYNLLNLLLSEEITRRGRGRVTGGGKSRIKRIVFFSKQNTVFYMLQDP